MNMNIFKAYDIRGKYPKEINEKVTTKIVSVITRDLKPKIVIVGRDTRLSSPSLYKTVLDLLKANPPTGGLKLKTVPAGIITTPMLYFLVNHFNADLGIMITASHNPKEYNGLKIVGKKAIPISGKEILKWIT